MDEMENVRLVVDMNEYGTGLPPRGTPLELP
jgi:hypothetical protein